MTFYLYSDGRTLQGNTLRYQIKQDGNMGETLLKT